MGIGGSDFCQCVRAATERIKEAKKTRACVTQREIVEHKITYGNDDEEDAVPDSA